MIKSMTGFARVSQETDQGQIVVELRSVNHRYLEQNVRLPEELRFLEPVMRESVQGALSRGKIDVTLRYKPSTDVSNLAIDDARVRGLLDTLGQVEDLMKNPARISALELLQWPGVIQEQQPDTEALSKSVKAVVTQALEDLISMRKQEGARIAQMLQERLQIIEDIVSAVRGRRVEVLKALREKLLARLESLDVEADPSRLEQELAFIAQKLDVDEELDRLESHIHAAREALQKTEPVGRKLDFLMQEFNREANTLSSKSADTQTTAAAVEMKVLIEQMREQVQNIE